MNAFASLGYDTEPVKARANYMEHWSTSALAQGHWERQLVMLFQLAFDIGI